MCYMKYKPITLGEIQTERDSTSEGAECHSRGHQVCSHSVVPQHFMEHEGSLPNSEELSNSTYPELDQSSPTRPILFPRDLS
jgi:hypothetical protein